MPRFEARRTDLQGRRVEAPGCPALDFHPVVTPAAGVPRPRTAQILRVTRHTRATRVERISEQARTVTSITRVMRLFKSLAIRQPRLKSHRRDAARPVGHPPQRWPHVRRFRPHASLTQELALRRQGRSATLTAESEGQQPSSNIVSRSRSHEIGRVAPPPDHS
jgi:hypothetical protein